MHHRRVVSEKVVARIKTDPAALKAQSAFKKLHTAQWFECCNGGGVYRIDLIALELDAKVRDQVVSQLSVNRFLNQVIREVRIEAGKAAVTLWTRRPIQAKDLRSICEKCIEEVLSAERIRVESALWPFYRLH